MEERLAMASPVVVYFAGIGTVVAALGIGFGSAIMLTSTTPVQKVPPAAFAKKEQPVEPQAPAPVAVVAPAPAATESSDDKRNGLAPPLASPVPKAEAVTRALALNPPPADAAPAPAGAEILRPVPTARPAAAPQETSGAKTKEPQKDVTASETKPDRRVVERRQSIAEKQKAGDGDEEEPAPETPRVSEEPDRPTREGF
jgi:hypothetical protein